MPYRVILTPEAQDDLRRLNAGVRNRLLDKLEWMGENAELLHHQVLQGEEWSGCYKYRIGDYRIIYQLDRSLGKVIILKVGHRREVYHP
ncbi:MAG: type II toxin-antitoxin system mRNA interferase toxin, RelE/StbE family [Anaerolinea sp.]|nr:type II toxin-antitoxin system mRNA interferase toxin, RelE/StbE family [Anaerolinea sp.]